MALITCPYCGGKISDSAQSCVHCGKLLQQQSLKRSNSTDQFTPKYASPNTLSYSSLPDEERLNLDNEFFYKENKEYGKNLDAIRSIEDSKNSICIAGGLSVILLVVYLAINRSNYNFSDNLLFYLLFCVILFTVLFEIVFIIISGIILHNLYNKKIISLKRYALWLEKRNIKFTPTFSSGRHEKYYKNINLEYETY